MKAGGESTSTPSPGFSSIHLTDCIDELLRFTLSSSLHDAADVGLSLDYISLLLQHEPFSATDSFEGFSNFNATSGAVLTYPLYKHLARAIYRCISSGKFIRVNASMDGILLDDSLDARENDWDELIADKGSKLFKIFSEVNFQLHLQEPLSRGAQIYRRFYNEKEQSNDVPAISISSLSSQPYILMADILMGLSFDGVGCLLGLVHTAGTVVDALPPAISTLVSSAIKPHKPYVKGCTLTVAARELTKHVFRSTEKWWGCISGGDCNKNKLALGVIYRLLSESCWQNIHIIQPHGSVFEVRVPEGYGARWSKDGSEFIGFLEPYTEEGYSRKWKH